VGNEDYFYFPNLQYKKYGGIFLKIAKIVEFTREKNSKLSHIFSQFFVFVFFLMMKKTNHRWAMTRFWC